MKNSKGPLEGLKEWRRIMIYLSLAFDTWEVGAPPRAPPRTNRSFQLRLGQGPGGLGPYGTDLRRRS